MGPKPGQIRCPTCHRSTLPAAYCTHCGSPIPESARARPRGLDRDELQDRIRARRSGPMPFRRGSTGDEGYAAPPHAERYEPEPEDERVRRRRAAAGGAAGAAAGMAAADPGRRVDNTAPNFDAEADAARRRAEEQAAAAARQESSSPWSRPAQDQGGPFRRGREVVEPESAAASASAPAVEEHDEPPWPDESRPEAPARPAQPEPVPAASPEVIDRFDDDAYETPDPRYYYETEEQRSDGIGVGAVLGIAALGVLALFVGIMLAGVLGDRGVGEADTSPSASATASDEASDAPSQTAAPSLTATPAPSASASGGEFAFPDGFVAEAQPCANPPNSADCGSSGARNNGNVWIVVSFRNGTASDVVSATVEQADGTQVPGGGSIALADINCGDSCNGYTYFQFQNLEDGTYTVHVTRNGEPAGETGFTVER